MPRLVMIVPLLVLAWVHASPVVQATVPPFEPPLPLSPSATTDDLETDWNPTAATDGSGTWVVAWSSDGPVRGTNGTDFDILFARSTDGGITFTTEAPLNTDAATDSEEAIGRTFGFEDRWPALAAHGTRFIAVWHRQRVLSDTIALARSDDAGVTWTAPSTLFGWHGARGRDGP